MSNDLYIEVNSSGIVINVIVYDGTSPYNSGPNIVLWPWNENVKPWIGWQWNEDGSFTPPPDPIEETNL